MSNIKNALSTLIETTSVIITNCTNAEELLLATKASSTLLTTDYDSIDSVNRLIEQINTAITVDGVIGESIEALFLLYDKLVSDAHAIIDIYMIAKSLKGLMESVFDSIILIDSIKSMDQINYLIDKSKALMGGMISKVIELSAALDNSESGFFASKLMADIQAISDNASDTQLHFQSIEQINAKLDASINETKNEIGVLSGTINSISTRLTDTANLLHQLIDNKTNPHEVTKAQIGLEHALVAHKTDDLTTNDTNSVHSAKATNEIWKTTNKHIEDCPNDGKYYVRQHGVWVEGVVVEKVLLSSKA